jgi:mRNA-degrading endonuclease RelE of RelBE toxin-antitoxin system
MAHRVLLGRRAEKALRSLSPAERQRAKKGLAVLEDDPVTPRPNADIKRLKGGSVLFRIRIGPWRAIYGLHDGDVIVTDFFHKKRGYEV